MELIPEITTSHRRSFRAQSADASRLHLDTVYARQVRASSSWGSAASRWPPPTLTRPPWPWPNPYPEHRPTCQDQQNNRNAARQGLALWTAPLPRRAARARARRPEPSACRGWDGVHKALWARAFDSGWPSADLSPSSESEGGVAPQEVARVALCCILHRKLA